MWMPYLELLVLQLFVACTTCQPFIVPVEICPGDRPEFTCTVEDVDTIGTTLWVVTMNGTEDTGCSQLHQALADRRCGPNMELHSFIVFVDSGNYTSTLTTVRSISPSFNGTGVQCAAPRRENVIGSSEICITGGSIVPPHISSAVIIEVGVSGSECVVTVSWCEPVISCNGSTSQYVLTVSPNTTECPSGSCEVGRGEERFEKRELNVTLTVEQMYNFTVRADTCNNNQTGQDSEQVTIQMEATSESCEYIFSYNGSSFDIDTISISWRPVNLGVHVSSRIQYSLVINPGGQRVPVSIDNCYSTQCSYMYTPDGSETDYSVSVEAVGCVTGTTACRNMSSRCDVADLLEGLNATKANATCYVFPEGAVCYTGISEGSIANYSSNTDYLLSDPNNTHRMCMNGSWTGLVPMFLPTATPTTLPISVKLTEAEISLLVIGLLAFIIGVCVGASIGMVLFLRADNKIDGIQGIVELIVCMLGLPVAVIVYCLVKKKRLDEEGVHLSFVYKLLLWIAIVFTMIVFALWILLMVYSLTQEFVENENDSEIAIRRSFIITCFFFSVLKTLMWVSCAILSCCLITSSGREESDSSTTTARRSQKSKKEREVKQELYDTLGYNSPQSSSPHVKPNDPTYGHLEQNVDDTHNEEYSHIMRGEAPKAVPNPDDPAYSHFQQGVNDDDEYSQLNRSKGVHTLPGSVPAPTDNSYGKLNKEQQATSEYDVVTNAPRHVPRKRSEETSLL